MNPAVNTARWRLERRALLAATGLACVSHLVRATEPRLPVATALAEHLNAALGKGGPLVVMVSLPGCPFCKVVRESHLAPMHREQGLAVVQLDLQNRDSVRDFKGSTVTQAQQIQVWSVRIAPTVLFFGRNGVEVAQRLVGAYLPDFYGAYLDQRLETARKALA